MRLRSSLLTFCSLARIFFLLVIRLTLNRPLLVFAHARVKPKKSNVSGLQGVPVQLDPIEHDHRQAQIRQRTAHQPHQLPVGPLNEHPRPRRAGRRPGTGLDPLAHRLLRPPKASVGARGLHFVRTRARTERCEERSFVSRPLAVAWKARPSLRRAVCEAAGRSCSLSIGSRSASDGLLIEVCDAGHRHAD